MVLSVHLEKLLELPNYLYSDQVYTGMTLITYLK